MQNIFQKAKFFFRKRLPVMDLGKSEPEIFLSGMARSGTTWVGELINYNSQYRVLFEPFHSVKENFVEDFEYIQYLPQAAENPVLESRARHILSGKVQNSWVNHDNRKFIYKKRMAKEICSNLMLGWLQRIYPEMKTILLVRHPLAIVSSWMKKNWGAVSGKPHLTDLDVILAQPELLRDYPALDNLARRVDMSDPFERLVFEFGILYYVPFLECRDSSVHVLYYENLLLHFKEELTRLFDFLSLDAQAALEFIDPLRPSSTNFLDRSFSPDKSAMLTEWSAFFSDAQITRARDILSHLGLDTLYDENGIPAFQNFPPLEKLAPSSSS